VAPERGFTTTQVLGDDVTAAEIEADLAPEGLAGLTTPRRPGGVDTRRGDSPL
jgi:hypothetical protein